MPLTLALGPCDRAGDGDVDGAGNDPDAVDGGGDRIGNEAHSFTHTYTYTHTHSFTLTFTPPHSSNLHF